MLRKSNKGLTKKTRTTKSYLAIALMGALGLTACASDSDATGGSSEEQVLRFALSAEPDQPITGMQQGTAMQQLNAMVHRGLVEFGSDGEIVEGLAESVDQVDDTVYVFKIHEGLTFNDGSELTVDNVKNSLDYYRDPENGAFLAGALSDVESIEETGDREITVTLSAPNAAFLEVLALPQASIVPDESLNSETANWVGAGPFYMEELNQGVGLTMRKHDGFYDSENVALDTIDVRFYPDGDARTNALLSGDVDMVDYVTWENFDRIEEADFTIDSEYGPFQYVQFNVEDTPFSDPLVRQAVAHAVNRENTVNAAFYGHGTPLSGVSILESDPAYDENLSNMWEHDPERAKELLEEAGYPDGFDATLLSTSQYTFLQDNALSVQEDLKAIGINATLQAPDWPSRILQGDEGEYDLAVSGSSGMVPDSSYLRQWVSGTSGYNESYGYKNEEILTLIEEGLRVSDEEEKHALYQEIGEIWKEDVPFVGLNMRAQAYAYNDSVEGFSSLPGALTFYSGYNFTDISMN